MTNPKNNQYPQEKQITKLPKIEDLGKLELIAGGPLELNQDGTFNLETINNYLSEHNLELEIVYFANENRLGFSIYRTANPLTEEVKKFSDEGDFYSVRNNKFNPVPEDFRSVKDSIHPIQKQKLEPESKCIQENPNEITISGVKYNYTPKKKDKK